MNTIQEQKHTQEQPGKKYSSLIGYLVVFGIIAIFLILINIALKWL